MVNLPIESDRIATSDAPRSSLSGQDIASPYGLLAENLSKTSELTNELAKDQATRAGLEAVSPDGKSVARPAVPIVGDAAESFSRAVRVTALNRMAPEIENHMAEIRIEHQNDPSGFKAAADAYTKQYVSNVTDPLLKAPLEKAALDNAGANYRSVLQSTDNTNAQNLLTTSQARLSEINDRSAAMARQGLVDTPAYAELHQSRAMLYRTLINDPRTGFTQERADIELKANRDRDIVEQTIGQAVNGKDNEADVRKALEEKFWGAGSERLSLSPQKRNAAIAEGVAAFNNRNAEDSAETQALRSTVGTYASNIQANPRSFDDVTHNSLVAQAAARGDRKSVNALETVKTFAPFWQGLKSLSAPELAVAVDQMSHGIVPNAAGTAIERRLVNSESSGDPTKVNQLGYAGLYQFGAPRLADIGVYTPGPGENLKGWSGSPATAAGKWTGTFNVPGFPQVHTLQDFLASPDAQRAAYQAHRGKMDQEITSLGLDKFEGQTVGGVTINRNALYGMMHLGGAQGALNALQSGGADAARDANGTSVMDYARRFAGGDGLVPGSPIANSNLYVQKLFQSTIATLREQQGTMATKLADDLIDRSNKRQRPEPSQIEDLVLTATSANRPDLLEKVKPALLAYEKWAGLYQQGNVVATEYGVWVEPPPSAAIVAAQARVAAGGSVGLLERQVFNHLADYAEQGQQALTKNPLNEAASRGWVRAVNPLDTTDPRMAAAEFAARERKVGIVQQRSPDIGAVKVVGDDEAEGFANALTRGDSTVASGLIQAMSVNLSSDNFVATLSSKPVANAVTGMINNLDPVRMNAGMMAADKLWRINPAAAETALGAAAATKLHAWQALKQNFEGPEIAKMLNTPEDPTTIKVRKELKTLAETETASLSPADMAYKLGSSWGVPVLSSIANTVTGATPAAPFDPIAGGALVSEYRQTYAALRAYGVDADSAPGLALQRLRSTWGISAAAGNQLMRNPPENSPLYPSIGGSKDWIAGDLKAWVTRRMGMPEFRQDRRSLEIGPALTAGPHFFGNDHNWKIAGLISDPRTEADISGGRPPSYSVAVRQADGTLKLLGDDRDPSNPRLAFDPKNHVERYVAQLQTAQKRTTINRWANDGDKPSYLFGAAMPAQ